ncbi:hypothetical protein BJX63DRAFT_434023 [Aspergillus granulosus]|uniref:Uncharacterized protein n=1 Tax=Aspergillus granulosus TaxID=176169 RepID=A0ABR4H5Q0_9EURO
MPYQSQERRVLNNLPMRPPTTQTTSRASTVSKNANVLDGASTPYLLWGWIILTLHTTEVQVPEIEFVMPEGKLQAAIDKLVAAGYPACEAPTCVELFVDRAAGVSE